MYPEVITMMNFCSARVAFQVVICFCTTRDASPIHNLPSPKFLELYDNSGSHSGSRKHQRKFKIYPDRRNNSHPEKFNIVIVPEGVQ